MKKPKPPADLWAQMDAISGAPRTQDDPGISAAEFAERHNISWNSAAKRLRTLAISGKLIVGNRKLSNGQFVKVYRPA